jgi:hypothetical protein
VIVVVVGNDDYVDDGEVFDFTGWWCEALVIFGVERCAAVFENGVEEHAQAAGEFDVVAGVAKPCCSEGGSVPCGAEGRCADRDSWRCGVGTFGCACYFVPRRTLVRVLWMFCVVCICTAIR